MFKVGGFGVGSDLAYQILVGLLYPLSDSVQLGIGYRHLDLDYEDGDFAYDVATSGPIAGIVWSL